MMEADLRSSLSRPELDLMTPSSSRRAQATKITEAQKQALIDNLQLEVTERARKLRAQYALQAQSLRTRIELRINRIPTAIRKSRMRDLWEEHQLAMTKASHEKKAVPSPSRMGLVTANARKDNPVPEQKTSAPRLQSKTPTAHQKGMKRTSDAMMNDDKENTPDPEHMLPNPKRRANPTDNSRQPPNPSTVLSPKSSNSQNLPKSPSRPPLTSPQKSYFSRPTSPLKPSMTQKASPAKSAALAATANPANFAEAASKATRGKTAEGRQVGRPGQRTQGPSTRQKRGGIPQTEVAETRLASSGSNTSMTSSATTIVRKATKTTNTTKSNPKVDVQQIKKGTRAVKGRNRTENAVASKKEVPLTGRRVLRTRA